MSTGTLLSPEGIERLTVFPFVSEIEDCSGVWTFEPNSMDFVHMRYLYGSISDWSALFREAYKVTKPGGWVESYEASAMMESDDGSVSESSAMREWGKFFIEGGKRMNRTFTILDDNVQETCMREAGFVNIQVKNLKVCRCGWYLLRRELSGTNVARYLSGVGPEIQSLKRSANTSR